MGIEQVFAPHFLVPEHGTPEGHDVGGDMRLYRDLYVLYPGRVGPDAQLARHRRNPLRQLDVALAQPVDVVRL